MALEDDLDTLYACAPGELLDRRKALAQALRKSGRRDDAVVVAAAVKPTPAAWAVNQLARRNPGEMAELMGAGERLRGLLRASFTGRADAGAMADAQAAQREIVARLARLAVGHLEGVGAPGSAAVIERVTATLTTISTTGAWGGSPPGRLTKELEAPGIEALAALVGDVASEAACSNTSVNDAPAASAVRRGEGRIQGGGAARRGEGEEPRRQEKARAEQEKARAEEEARRVERARQEEEARRAAAEARARIERAEAALRAASEIEERARAALESARSAAGVAASERERREVTAREARRLATEQEKAAEDARRKAEAAVLAARSAEEEAAGAARAEQAAKAELSAAERAVARAAAGCIEAEEALVRERRAGERPPA